MSRKELEELFEKHYQGMKLYGVETEFTEDDIKRLGMGNRQVSLHSAQA